MVRVLRGVVRVAVPTALGLLLAAGLAPFVLREEAAAGSAVDTSATLTGEAQAASEGLRGLGFSCADVEVSPEALTRVCNRVRLVESAEVRMVADPATGAILTSTARVDDGRTAQATRDRLRQLVPDRGGFRGPPAGTAPITLTGSVDVLAAAARTHGYVCTTPEVQTVRGCTRHQGGYAYHLWMQGTDRYLATLDLSVNTTYRTQTRQHWADEMTVVLSWLDTDQGRNLAAWVDRDRDAPGAKSYVDGLPVSFLVRNDEYTKETFGGVAPECGRVVDNISGCEP